MTGSGGLTEFCPSSQPFCFCSTLGPCPPFDLEMKQKEHCLQVIEMICMYPTVDNQYPPPSCSRNVDKNEIKELEQGHPTREHLCSLHQNVSKSFFLYLMSPSPFSKSILIGQSLLINLADKRQESYGVKVTTICEYTGWRRPAWGDLIC